MKKTNKASKPHDTEKLKQLIFTAKTEKEKKMWEKVLEKVKNGNRPN